MRSVVIYAKANDGRQATKTTAIEPQLGLLREAARRFRFSVIGEFSEVRGTEEAEFHQLNQAIDFAGQHQADLLVLRPDRLGTNLMHLHQRVQACRENRILICFCPVRSDAASETMFDNLSVEVIEQRRQRMENKKEKAREGRLRYMEGDRYKKENPQVRGSFCFRDCRKQWAFLDFVLEVEANPIGDCINQQILQGAKVRLPTLVMTTILDIQILTTLDAQAFAFRVVQRPDRDLKKCIFTDERSKIDMGIIGDHSSDSLMSFFWKAYSSVIQR